LFWGYFLDLLMQGANYFDDGFIAEVHNSAEVWVRIPNIQSQIVMQVKDFLHLRYKSDITMIYY